MTLLTGATGLVGSELLNRLAAKPGARVYALTRRRDQLPNLRRHAAVTALQADLQLPNLGLDEAAIGEIQGSITEIIHCAAETRFDLRIEQARAANVESTASLLALALGCRRLEKFAHVSTVYVAGRQTGSIPEAPLSHADGFTNTYQQSKYEAESLVLAAMRELPITIFRFSSIIGDSRTGRVRQFNHVHQLLRVLPQNVLPMAPGDPSAPVDLIPSDWAATALAWLIENRFAPGRIYQLCAGPDESLTLRELIDMTVQVFESHPRRRWGPIRIPALVSLREYEEYVEKMRRGGNKLLNEVLRLLGYFLPHLSLSQAFENRLTCQALSGSAILLPPVRSYYRSVLDYCLETNWGRIEGGDFGRA